MLIIQGVGIIVISPRLIVCPFLLENSDREMLEISKVKRKASLKVQHDVKYSIVDAKTTLCTLHTGRTFEGHPS